MTRSSLHTFSSFLADIYRELGQREIAEDSGHKHEARST
jgi:hypothetical protein